MKVYEQGDEFCTTHREYEYVFSTDLNWEWVSTDGKTERVPSASSHGAFLILVFLFVIVTIPSVPIAVVFITISIAIIIISIVSITVRITIITVAIVSIRITIITIAIVSICITIISICILNMFIVSINTVAVTIVAVPWSICDTIVNKCTIFILTELIDQFRLQCWKKKSGDWLMIITG